MPVFVHAHTCESDFVIRGKTKKTIFAVVLKHVLAVAAQASLEFLAVLQIMIILLPQRPKHWNYVHATSCLA